MAVERTQEQLLLGLLAFQNGFISQSELLNAFRDWLTDRSKGLDHLLVGQNAISEQDCALLMQMVERHVSVHDNDAEKSLASISSLDEVIEQFDELATATVAAEDLRSILWNKKTFIPGKSTGEAVARQHRPDDRFRIIRQHAHGGLGIVFVAEDTQMRREVALKQIRTDVGTDRADSSFLQSRFLQEAEITGQLEHPGIVPVYALGADQNGRPYYAMRFIRGEDLQSRIREFHRSLKETGEPFDGAPLRQLLRRFLDVCDAIGYAHARGVLHRDLKPGNVMLGKHGETLVVDWGLAKPFGKRMDEASVSSPAPSERPVSPSGSHSGSETLDGSFIGTPAYAPPEQLRGELERLCPASDVYSLGAILYELLTGQSPVPKGLTLDQVLKHVTSGSAPEPRVLNAAVTRSLNAVCQRAMALEIRERYSSVEELKQDVEAWLDDLPVSVIQDGVLARSARWFRRHRAAAKTALIGLALVTLTSTVGGAIANHYRIAATNALLSERIHAIDVEHSRGETANAIRLTKDLITQRRSLPVDIFLGHCEDYLAIADLPQAMDVLRLLDSRQLSETEAVRRDFLMGRLKLHTNDHEVAITMLRHCLATKKLRDDDQLYGEGLLASTPDESIQALQNALSKNPLHQFARSALAATLILTGDVTEASSQAQMGSRLHPQDPQFLMLLAIIHAMRGNGSLKDQFLEEALSRIPIESHDDTRNLIETLVDAAVGFQAVVGASERNWEQSLSPDFLLETLHRGAGSFELIFPSTLNRRWHFSLPVGDWTVRLREAMNLTQADMAEVELTPVFRVSATLVRAKTEPLIQLLPRNQFVLYLAGLAKFAEASTPEEYVESRNHLRRAAGVEVIFPGLKEQALDIIPLASVLIDSSNFMDQQRDVIAAVANGGLRSTNTPAGKDFFWTLLIRNGLYQPAEDLARAALESCVPEERPFWELRVQRTTWFRAQLAAIGQRANQMTAEEVASELAKSNDDAK